MKRFGLFPLLAGLLALTAVSSLALGRYPLPVGDVVGLLLSKGLHWGQTNPAMSGMFENLVMDIRMPRILAALLIGASLSVSGASFQAMFLNPLVSPGLLGVLAGAAFGAALGMVLSKSWIVVQGMSLAFGFVAVILSLGIAKVHKGNTLLLLVLGGVISTALFTSLLSVIKYVADPYNQLPEIVRWLMGGLSFVDRKVLYATAIPQALAICAIALLSGYLNALSMGDEEARSLGVPVKWIRILLIFLATFISSMTVVLAGMILWVGLIIPHITRMLVGPDNRVLIPASALIGAIYLIVVDDLSRMAFSVEIPIGISTSLVGITFFAVILRKARRGWN